MQKNKKPGNGIGIVKENRPMKSTNMTGKRNQNKKSIILEKNAEKLDSKNIDLKPSPEQKKNIEEKKRETGFVVPVYVVASVVLLLFAFVGGMDNIESIQSGMSMYNDDYVYRKSIYEVGLSVFVWIGLILAIIFESKWKKRKNIMIIGPLLQINAIFTAVAIPCEEFYLRYFDPERVWDIGGIVSEVFLGIICIYIFGGVAYTIAVCLKNRKQ